MTYTGIEARIRAPPKGKTLAMLKRSRAIMKENEKKQKYYSVLTNDELIVGKDIEVKKEHEKWKIEDVENLIAAKTENNDIVLVKSKRLEGMRILGMR